jgi:hypothetical protein
MNSGSGFLVKKLEKFIKFLFLFIQFLFFARDTMSDLPEIRNGQSKDKMPYHREAETHFQRKIRRGSTVLLDHITKVTRTDIRCIKWNICLTTIRGLFLYPHCCGSGLDSSSNEFVNPVPGMQKWLHIKGRFSCFGFGFSMKG